MADNSYTTFPAIFKSRGIVARYADDQMPEGTYLNLDSVEELTENALVTRLGSIIINRTGTVINALPAPIHSLAKLSGYPPTVNRYAGAGTFIYRRASTTQGVYSSAASGLSGNAWSWGVYRPTLSSFPYIFVADSALMLKENGSAFKQWGIFQPNSAVQAIKGSPQYIIIDEFNGVTGTYTFSNYTSPAITSRISSNFTSATPTGLQAYEVTNITNIGEFTLLDIAGANPETVLVFDVRTFQFAGTKNAFTATLTKSHLAADPITAKQLTGTVAANTVATVTRVNAYNLSTFPNGVMSQGADYICIYLNVDQPSFVDEIRLLFDVGDGSFTENYFYKVISPNQYQPSVSETVNPAQAVAQSIFNATVNVYGPGQINVAPLLTGNSVWSPILIQMSDFVGVGNAAFSNTTGFTFANINSFRIQITTNTLGSVNVGISNLVCFGGAGPDSFGGVAYDWLYTFYNNVTGAESNPSMTMSNTGLPDNSVFARTTTWITPRRQPVVLFLSTSISTSDVTSIRIYRRGGTLASNYFRVAEIPLLGASPYTDIASDAEIEAEATVSFINDVPVTSTLPIPINAALTSTIAGGGSIFSFSYSGAILATPHQQLTLGADADPLQEIVIVQTNAGNTATAFCQNAHQIGDPVRAEAVYGQPCNLMAVAYSAVFLAGDPNNPHYLYYSTNFSPESFGSANFIEIGVPSDPITAIVPFQGTLYVATQEHWYMIAPSTQTGAAPTVYPTSAVHGCVAPHGWVTTEREIWHQAIDGIRTFAGGASTYRTQEIEFLFQNNGVTPIVQADPAQFASTVMTYWNNIVFISYVGLDGNRHRINYHTVYQRWRNDDVPAAAMFTEPDTNDLLYGTATGLIHQDRIGTYIESNNAGTLGQAPIVFNMQTAYMDQGAPKVQKNYVEFTADVDTAGQTLNATLLFNDGQIVLPIGTLTTANRQKVNLNINAGAGQQAYRASLQITGSTLSRAILYQADIRATVLAETRQGFDTYWMRFSTDESKILKQIYLEYNSTAQLNASVYYDSSSTAGFTFTLPASQRISTRVRFPAVKFRLFRMIVTSTADFQVWSDSRAEIKTLCSGKGYQLRDFVP